MTETPHAVRVLGEVRLGRTPSDFLTASGRWVADTMRGFAPAAVTETARVLVALLADALRHGHPPFTVRLTETPGHQAVRVEVDDWATASTDAAAPVTGEVRWGVERRVLGRTVWAELPVARQA